MLSSKVSDSFSSPEQTSAHFFGSKVNFLSIRYCINGIRQRVRSKKKHGQKLSAVEAHLNRSLRGLERRVFGPSHLVVAAEIFKLFLRPVPILLVLGLIVASEASSSALFRTQDADDAAVKVVYSEMDTSDFNQDSLATRLLAKAAKSLESGLDAVSFQHQTQAVDMLEKQGLVQFISGLIVVYTPSVRDPGVIARHIVQVAQEQNVDPLYIASVIAHESSFRTHARSRVGATGLMQLLPNTAREVSMKQTGKQSRPQLTDVHTNIRLGIAYLKQLERRYRGDRRLALAAYNWGPTNVDKTGRNKGRFPRSVKRYSSSILEKTLRWNKHFSKAAKNAQELAAQLSKTEESKNA